jgi:hypothetical protein
MFLASLLIVILTHLVLVLFFVHLFFSLPPVNILVLSLWTGLSPFQWEREILYTDEFGQPTESMGFCTSHHSVYYYSVLAVIDLGALVYALYETYRARNLSTEFAESAYIARALLLIMAVSFLGIPIAIIAGDEPRSKFVALSGIIFTICLSLLMFIFVPKELYRRKGSNTNTINLVGSNMGIHRPGTVSGLSLDESGLDVVDNRLVQEELRNMVDTLGKKVKELEESQKQVQVPQRSQTSNDASVDCQERVSQDHSAAQEQPTDQEGSNSLNNESCNTEQRKNASEERASGQGGSMTPMIESCNNEEEENKVQDGAPSSMAPIIGSCKTEEDKSEVQDRASANEGNETPEVESCNNEDERNEAAQK